MSGTNAMRLAAASAQKEIGRALEDALARTAETILQQARDTLTARGQGSVAERMHIEETAGGYQLIAASPAAYLEFGTVKMPAQSFLQPALDDAQERMEAIAAAAFSSNREGSV